MLSQLQKLVISPTQIQNQQIVLTSQQQHYLSRVLRLKQGDRFIAIDGGKWWLAQLLEPTTRAEIIQPLTVQTELPIEVTLMVALPKGQGFDDVVRQVTELGVTCIAPIISDRTLLNPSGQKLERWRRIAQEAAEQAERQIVPTILDPVPFSTSLSSVNNQDLLLNHQQYICVTRADSPHLLTCLQSKQVETFTDQEKFTSPPTPSSIIIAIGPEGGWTEAEVEKAVASDFQPVSLGQRILRAVTAPVVALSLVAATWEQLKKTEDRIQEPESISRDSEPPLSC